MMGNNYFFKQILSVCMLLMLPLLSWAHDFKVDGIYYNINQDGKSVSVTYYGISPGSSASITNNGITITEAKSVEIPSTVSFNATDYAVTAIGDQAFFKENTLETIIIPNTVTSIGNGAFTYCSKLKNVVIPSSVETIGDVAFAYCFALDSLDIPEGVTSIGNGAFGNTNIKHIKLSSSVTKIGNFILGGCQHLESVVIESGNEVYDSREGCNAIIDTKSNTLIAGCNGTVIPNSVTSIGTRAFFSCSNLKSISIPSSVDSIGKDAFLECSKLESIEISGNVTDIGQRAFYGCSSLASIVVSPDNKVYDSREGCNAIVETKTNTLIVGCKNTTFPSTVQRIGVFAFSGSTAITSIEIPDGITSIGDYAFGNCSKLKSVVIPKSVTSIGKECFSGCTSLRTVTCMTDDVINIVQPSGQKGVFAGVPFEAKLCVPDSLIDKYFSSDGWKSFSAILPIGGAYSDKTTNKEDNGTHTAINGQSADESVFEVVEQSPQFKGGMDGLMKFLANNLKYPAEAQKKGTRGRVLVQFFVEKDGSLTEPRILRSVDPLLDKEALRVISLMPKWEPGKQRGKPVRVRYTFPISFNLQ